MVRRVIESERSDDAGDDCKDSDETLDRGELGHMKDVYVLKNGKLELQPRGMGEFERSLEKRLAKARSR